MDLAQVERFVAELGISDNPAHLAAVIRFVQRTERTFECFGTARGGCDQHSCAWRRACLDGRKVPIPTSDQGTEVRHPRLSRALAVPSIVESHQPILPTA